MSKWVLLRGLSREARHWGDFPNLLQAALAAEQVICVDIPGNGERHDERSALDVTVMMESCRQSLRARDAAPPYCILAMSLGGLIAITWATRHPQEVSAAAIVNTSFGGLAPLQQRLRPSRWARLVALLLMRDPLSIERNVLEMTSRHPSVPVHALLSDWVAIRRDHPVTRMNTLRQLWAAARFHATPHGPLVPVLALAAARDDLVDPICSRHLAQTWRCALAVHPTAGHDLPLDDPEWVLRQLATWLGKA